jgi:hypothetical protein
MTPMMRKVSLAVGAFVVLLVLAKLLGLFSLLSLRRAQAPPPIPSTLQTTWTIKFHTDSGSIKYDLVEAKPDADHRGCQYATTPPTTLDAKNLVVCQNDIILWQASTTGQQHDSVVFMTDHILKDQGNPGTSVITFLGKDGNSTTPPGLMAAPDTDWHDWYVVVIDRKTPTASAHDDPRIKVGG